MTDMKSAFLKVEFSEEKPGIDAINAVIKALADAGIHWVSVSGIENPQKRLALVTTERNEAMAAIRLLEQKISKARAALAEDRAGVAMDILARGYGG